MANDVVIGGRFVKCAVPVITWHESKLGFPGLPMLEKPDVITLHWTGSDGLAAQCHNTLRTRRDKKTNQLLNLSVNFFCDHLGRIYQFADATARTAHAGKRGNKRGCGIELSNRCTPIRVERGIVREVVLETINGESTARTTFTAPQVRATLALLETLCSAMDIPFRVPMNGNDVASETLPDEFTDAFSGIVPHFAWERRKQDCGLALLRAIAAKPKRNLNGAAE